ncbi:hypothetical protein ACWJIJ_00505 [Morganella morganii]
MRRIKSFFSKLWQSNENFNNFISGIHYIFLTLAIVISGIWVLYTFDALNMASNAEVQLGKANEELNQIKEQIKGSDSSSIVINTESLKTQLGLIININIKNNGKRPLSFNTAGDALTIYKVSVDGDAISQTKKYTPKVYASLKNNTNDEERDKIVPKMHVLIGAEKTLSYIVGVDSPGIYYIVFESVPDENFKEEKLQNEKPVKWFASDYVEIN